MHWRPQTLDEKQIEQSGLELRHLKAFQQVYLSRDYTAAGHELNTNRKGVLRMIDRLEKTFHCSLFTEQERGLLVPNPFADRLFNDLRFLNSAQDSLEEHIRQMRESGRLLKIGSSSLAFRTQTFRSLFRELQTYDRVRASYIPIKSEDAAKGLAAGTCDLHVGCWQGPSKRFISLTVGSLEFRSFTRVGDSSAIDETAIPYVIALDGMFIDSLPESGEKVSWRALPEARFLHWLDHPEECPAGTRIYGPDIPCDVRHWTVNPCPLPLSQTIRINFLRQHPYEFLETLGRGIHTRMTVK